MHYKVDIEKTEIREAKLQILQQNWIIFSRFPSGFQGVPGFITPIFKHVMKAILAYLMPFKSFLNFKTNQ
jgi:hypothetical protein